VWFCPFSQKDHAKSTFVHRTRGNDELCRGIRPRRLPLATTSIVILARRPSPSPIYQQIAHSSPDKSSLSLFCVYRRIVTNNSLFHIHFDLSSPAFNSRPFIRIYLDLVSRTCRKMFIGGLNWDTTDGTVERILAFWYIIEQFIRGSCRILFTIRSCGGLHHYARSHWTFTLFRLPYV
jgi:hypothetical protein